MIFISHRTTDEDVANMIVDYLVGVGVPSDEIFCSSRAGNDVEKRISEEVRERLRQSDLNIAILSKDYYESAYCLNEAGIFWYREDAPILIALPEINERNMAGFLNGDYKIRRLSSENDISFIYDCVKDKHLTNGVSATTQTNANNKLRKTYEEYLSERTCEKPNNALMSVDISEITTHDERRVLYCILEKNTRKVWREDVKEWLFENEIRNINISNAFDLLASIGEGTEDGELLTLDIAFFRKISKHSEQLCEEIAQTLHFGKEAWEIFVNLLDSGELVGTADLFAVYLFESGFEALECGIWEELYRDIKKWEQKNDLDGKLSDSYMKALDFYVKKGMILQSESGYAVYPSLKGILFERPLIEIYEPLEKIKKRYQDDLPF
ncbi:MAG: toll/interleukin-1 receptor domain-containing protein [Clostridia bacterium]|nr:toll/interleukin-1 receptor domain-containing protein [Clostridia bacterium]